MKNFQRNGSISNAHVGKDFVDLVKAFFSSKGIILDNDVAISIGVGGRRKKHVYDLGNLDNKIIVECKSHKWTESDKVPSAKMTVWTQEMFYFHLTPKGYRKIFFILKDYSVSRKETLGKYYLRINSHLIPQGVEFWEYDEKAQTAQKIS
ncbi:MAG: hypothetical protein V1727_00960 [Candidatus Omnitrophota bacterium]